MNRSEANTFADQVNELRKLEELKDTLTEAATEGAMTVMSLARSTPTSFSISGVANERIVGAGLAAMRSAAEAMISETKTSLGITDDPAPVAAEAETPADAPQTAEATGVEAVKVGDLVEGEPQTATLGDAEAMPVAAAAEADDKPAAALTYADAAAA